MFFDYLVTLDRSTYLCFTNIEWSKFVFAIIIAVRLSFSLPDLPDWDDALARRDLEFDKFLKTMCDDHDDDLTPTSTRADVLSAMRIILKVVQTKYDRRVAALNQQTHTPTSRSSSTHGCPMLDRSMDSFIAAWDPDLVMSSTMMGPPPPGQEGQQPMFHDLWATMTMGWANGW